MASILKKLAGETAIYGLSTILARMINFFLVPFYTRILTRESYGSYTEIMSYIAVLQVVLVLGLETGCFKFANRIKNESSAAGSGSPDNQYTPFSSSFITVLFVAALFFGLLSLFSGPIASGMGYKGFGSMIVYVGAVLALDSVTAILFAKLRYEQKALKFAIFKTIKILGELGFNLVLFFYVPVLYLQHPDSFIFNFIPGIPHFSYIIFAVFLSCLLCAVLFIPDVIKMKLRFDLTLVKVMLVYSLPLMIAALPGIINESLDRILFRFLYPPQLDWRADLGVYQAAVKLAVIMNLFIQMFRYASEPFFFAREKERGSRELYAKIMDYFVAFCIFIFLGVLLFKDIICLILGKDFRGAVGTLPFMLLAYMMVGMIFNVSMWYKLSGQTKMAIKITLTGLAVTAGVNLLLMPYIHYWASVAGHLLSALAMLLYSVWLGNKYYPIPYNWRRITGIIALGIIIYIVAELIGLYLVGGGDAVGRRTLGSYICTMLIGVAGLGVYCFAVYTLFKGRKTKAASVEKPL